MTFKSREINMERFQTPSRTGHVWILLAYFESPSPQSRIRESHRFSKGKVLERVHAQGKSSSNMPWSGNNVICGGDSSWCCSSLISLIRLILSPIHFRYLEMLCRMAKVFGLTPKRNKHCRMTTGKCCFQYLSP